MLSGVFGDSGQIRWRTGKATKADNNRGKRFGKGRACKAEKRRVNRKAAGGTGGERKAEVTGRAIGGGNGHAVRIQQRQARSVQKDRRLPGAAKTASRRHTGFRHHSGEAGQHKAKGKKPGCAEGEWPRCACAKGHQCQSNPCRLGRPSDKTVSPRARCPGGANGIDHW